MERAIIGFHRDAAGDWVAELACGHERHVRHEPPFQLRPWVVDAAGRGERLGTLLRCGRCEETVQPGGTVPDAGGEPPCLADVVCPECGTVLDGGPHRPGCTAPA